MLMLNPTFSYIQLHKHGKVPTREWRNDARALMPDVRDWLAQGFNLGVRTDKTSGVWVLDVDVDVNTLEPSQAWKDLVAEHPLPATYTVRTPSGGIHYYFRFPHDIDVRNDQGRIIAEGVDIRGTGGYVVAPGMFASYTKHDKTFEGTYDVLDETAPAETPEWILERFRNRETEAIARIERTEQPEMPKAEVIEEQWDAMARAELNELFAMAEALTALAPGEYMEILGEERGWERGSGFFVLACKIIEVARWPHTSVTVDQAHQAWVARVPAKYARHDWDNAIASAGVTWEFGDQKRCPVDLFEGVPYRGGVSAPGDDPGAAVGTEVLDASGLPMGWAVNRIFAPNKDGEEGAGQFKVDAARLIVEAQGRIAVDNSGSLWTYDGGVYRNEDSVVLDRLYRMMGDRFSSAHLTNTKLAIQATAPLIDLTRPPSPGTMNFTNGILEWRDGTLRPHNDATLETTQFPYDWDPDAGCPRFDHWLETMLEEDQIVLAWKVLGYMMLSGNPLQVAFMLYGQGSNGKSTFAHVIERLVGDSNASAVSLKDLSARFSTSSMIGKIANIVGDIDSDYQMSTAALKQVTGADALQFERKNRDSFRAVLWATCLFSANKIPGTSDGSEGYAERWVPIHFKRKASEHRIPGFTEEGLWEEIPGIAAKAVKALRTIPLDKGSDRAKAFDLTGKSSLEAVEEFREASNSYYDWIKNFTAPSESDVMKPKEIWAAYRTATGVRSGGTNCPKAFAKVLTEMHGEAKMRRGMYLGVQRNVRGYAVTILDDDDNTPATLDEIFGLEKSEG